MRLVSAAFALLEPVTFDLEFGAAAPKNPTPPGALTWNLSVPDRWREAFQAVALRARTPPRSERQARRPCERNRSAAAALRFPVAQISR